MYEFLWSDKYIDQDQWLKIINSIADYIGSYRRFNIIVQIENNTISYFLKTKIKMPIKIKEELPFQLKEITINFNYHISFWPYFSAFSNNILNIYTKSNCSLKYLVIDFIKINNHLLYKITGNFNDKFKRFYFRSFQNLISINFSNFSSFFYKKVPTYLNMNKTLHLLSSSKTNSILKINTYPYFNGDYFLNQNNYDFNKHSLILGSSGSGKSKFISLFIENTLARYNNKIVVIDPHGTLEEDIGGLGKVIDFDTNSVDLFGYNDENIITNQEKIVASLKDILKNNYNSKIERLLKYTIYLLLLNQEFNLINLKKVLLDTEYRNVLLNQAKNQEFIISFFTNDFNDLKIKSYSEAFVPIISLIDEISFLPVFNSNNKNTIEDEIDHHDLLLFSLKPSKLGLNNIKLISALIMNKIMAIKETWRISENVIFIVDEVSIVETEILSRILSEGRKYGLSLMLAGQFLEQLTTTLRNSIFANVLNYYLFRISKSDAIIMSNNIDIDLITKDCGDTLGETRQKLFTNLNDRELIIKLHKNGINYSCIKASTLDFVSIPRIKEKMKPLTNKKNIINEKKDLKFNIGNTKQDELMKSLSTKRKVNI